MVVIHQIWYNFREWGKYEGPPKELLEISDRWRTLNPDWIYMLWQEESSLQLLKMFYPKLLAKFLSFRRPIQRVDFFRWVVIYHFGGCFIDFDCIPLKPLSLHPKIGDKDTLIVPASWWVGNAMILATSPRHPAVAQVIDAMTVDDPWPFVYDKSVLAVFCTTGPLATNRILRQPNNNNHNAKVVFDGGLLWHVPGNRDAPGKDYFVKHLGKGSWGYERALWNDVTTIATILLVAVILVVFILWIISRPLVRKFFGYGVGVVLQEGGP